MSITKKPSWPPTNQSGDFTVLTEQLDLTSEWGLTDEGSRTIEFAGKRARVQPASCFQGRALSVTVRAETESHLHNALPNADRYTLASEYLEPPKDPGPFLNTMSEVASVATAALRLQARSQPHGFLVVSGSTKSGKSKLARGLIHLHLEELMKRWLKSDARTRKPHLVTCEDDIEVFLYEHKELSALEKCYQSNNDWPYREEIWKTSLSLPDYTPRWLVRSPNSASVSHARAGVPPAGEAVDPETAAQPRPDVESFEKAVNAALRMTPAVFYGGEIREEDDWRPLYRLAQSHLVVVTTHAASLVNTFKVLQTRLKLETPPQRSELIAAVYAVVHLRMTGACLLPSCWVNTEESRAAFTADGLASLVPRYPFLAGNEPQDCLGRRAFLEELVRVADSRRGLDELRRQAVAWDLAGE